MTRESNVPLIQILFRNVHKYKKKSLTKLDTHPLDDLMSVPRHHDDVRHVLRSHGEVLHVLRTHDEVLHVLHPHVEVLHVLHPDDKVLHTQEEDPNVPKSLEVFHGGRRATLVDIINRVSISIYFAPDCTCIQPFLLFSL